MTLTEAMAQGSPPGAIAAEYITATEELLVEGESIRYASIFDCLVNADPINGILALTSNRVIFLGPATNGQKAIQLPWTWCLGIGDIIGRPRSRMSITGGNTISLVVCGPEDKLAELQGALLDAIEAAPSEPRVVLPKGAQLLPKRLPK